MGFIGKISAVGVILWLSVYFSVASNENVVEEHIPRLGSSFKSVSQGGGLKAEELDIWQFKGLRPNLFKLFTTVELEIKLNTSDNTLYEVYQSTNKSEILREFHENRRFFGWFRRFAIWKSRQIPPFKKSFIGIETTAEYEARVKVTNLNFYYLSCFVTGLLLFNYAKALARNSIFYYTSGTGAGLLASLLIIVYVLHRLLPRRSVAYSALVGGWSFSLYLAYSLYLNIYTVLLDYHRWVVAYFVTVAFISFCVCYRLGPPKNPRSLHLCQWALMLIGAGMVIVSSQVVEIGIAIIATLLIWRNIPTFFVTKCEQIWYRLRPPKRRLLTEEEYMNQGVVETQKALAELREFCRSPKCDSWKLMGSVKSPQRFASFVSGDSHLSDTEILEYDLDSLSYAPRRGNSSEEDESDDDDVPNHSSIPSSSKSRFSRSLQFDSKALQLLSSPKRNTSSNFTTLKSQTEPRRNPRQRKRSARKVVKSSSRILRSERFSEGLGEEIPDPDAITSDEDV